MGRLELILETENVSMYSPRYDNEENNEFNKFLIANRSHTHPQLKKFFEAILSFLEKIGETGALERYFRLEGGNIKAIPLYVDEPMIDRNVGKMRLYCLRLSDRVLILGGGTVTSAKKNKDDQVILEIIGDLKDIEHSIKKLIGRAGTDYEDFDALKQILETIRL